MADEITNLEEGIPVVRPEDQEEASAAGAGVADPTTTNKSDHDTNSSTTGSDHDGAAAAAAAVNQQKTKKTLTLAVITLVALALLGAAFGGGFAAGVQKEKKRESSSKTTTTTTSSQSSAAAGDNSNSMYMGDDDYMMNHYPEYDDDYVFVNPFGGEDGVDFPSLTVEEMLQGYESREDLDADLTIYFQKIANKMIENNVLNNMGYGYHPRPVPMVETEDGMMVPDVELQENMNGGTDDRTDDAVLTEVASEAAATVSTASAKTHGSTLTNNQEKDVDEADVAKNDENYIYGMYGQVLVVLDRRTGDIVTQEKLAFPEIEVPEELQGPEHQWMVEEMMMHSRMVSAQFLQLTDNHVIVPFSQPQGYFHDPRTGMPLDNGGSTMLVYLKPTPEDPKLTLVASQELPGMVTDSRYLEDSDSIHITSNMQWSGKFSEMEYYYINHDGTRKDYVEKATAKAEEVIAEMVQKVGDVLMPTDGAVTMRLGKMERAGFNMTEDPYAMMNGGAAIITAVRAQDLPTTAGDAVIPTTSASALTDNSYGTSVYATGDSIVLTSTAYGTDTETQMGIEIMTLTHLKVDPTTASMTFHTVGTTTGHLPNKYGIDIQGNDLRLATVINVGIVEDAWANMEEVCGLDWRQDECLNSTAYDSCVNLMLNGCQNVESTGCPKEYTCADDEDTEENLELSSTANHIVVMDISEPGEMKELGRVRIGKVNEVIFGARFGETFVYANTFDQQDPFYAIDLQPGQGPKIIGSVELGGFYNFIEPVNDDGTVLVAIGQNTTGEDNMLMPHGVMLTVFDVSSHSDPKVVDSVMVAQKENNEVSSHALYEPKSIQHKDGVLVIPLNTYMTGYQIMFNGMSANFDGFIAVDVGNAAEQGIKELYQVDHTCTGNNCYTGCHGGLQSYRSFIYEDTLATMSTQLVVGSNVTDGTTFWSTVVDTSAEESEDGMRGCW